MGQALETSRKMVSNAQGFEEAEPQNVNLEPDPEPLSPQDQQKADQDKLRLFSEFVAGEAEANSAPEQVKEKEVERPLTFRYYEDDNDDGLTQNITDSVLATLSVEDKKNDKHLKYSDEYEKELGITPEKPVDYTK